MFSFFYVFVAVSGGWGEVRLWVAEGLIIILRVRRCRDAWVSHVEISGSKGGMQERERDLSVKQY